MLITKECAGCRACEMVCPVKAIEMVENVEGFREPKIDLEKCIDCGLCKKICPQENQVSINRINNEVAYAAQISEEKILMTSTSGGFFAALALDILNSGGVVFGVKMNEDSQAVHCMIVTEEELYRIRSSKYVASDTLSTYYEAKEKLDKGVTVLYSGCPCQIAGLRAYLRKDYANLLTVDIVCHGTPSQKLFDVYRQGMKQKLGCSIENYQFRDKSKYGWGVYWSYTYQSGRKKMGGLHDDPYCSAFIDHVANRECCYKCKYVGVENRIGDITLGDYWGVDQIHPEMASNKGVSAVVVNTDTGKVWADKAIKRCKSVPTDVQSIAKYNPSLVISSNRPDVRDTVYDGIDSKTPLQFVNENLHLPFKNIIKTRIRLLIPYNFRVMMKKVKRIIN